MKAKTLIENKNDYKAKMLNLKLEDKLKDIVEYAQINGVPIIKDEGLAFLITLLMTKKPKRILEIGTAIGYSASLMALYSEAIIDTMEIDENSFKVAQNNVKSLGLEKRINLFLGDALTLKEMVKDNQYDLVFIDGPKGQYINFFELYEPLLLKGGVVVTDNLYFHDLLFEEIESKNLYSLVRKIDNYNQYLIERKDYETHIFNIGDGIGVSIKK